MIEYQQYISDIIVGIATIAGIGMYVKNKLQINEVSSAKYETETSLFTMLKESLETSKSTINELQDEVKILKQQLEKLENENNQLNETKIYLESKIILLTNLINRLTYVIDEATVKIENVISEE